MKKTFLSFLIVLVTVHTYGQNKAQDAVNKQEANIKGFGVVALADSKGNIEIGTKGFASPNILVDENTLFGIGSITKTFTAVVLLKLVEEKKIQLDDAIYKYIDLKNKNIDSLVTIRQLLNHSSGIKDYGNAEFLNKYSFNKRLCMSLSDKLNQIDSVAFVRGTKNEYSNSNYLILSLIIEKVTDMSFSRAVEAMILRPYELKNTYTYLSKDLPNLAHPMQNGEDLSEKISMLTITEGAVGDGQIVSNVRDLDHFFSLLLREKKILKLETLALMLDFQASEQGEMGLGILKMQGGGKDFIFHDGRIISYRAYLYYVPQDDFIGVVLLNDMDMPYGWKILNGLFMRYLSK